MFLLKVIENYGFSQDFLKRISTLLQNQEFHVINGGKTTRYIPLKRAARQGDLPIFLFRPTYLVLEIVFTFIKESQNV